MAEHLRKQEEASPLILLIIPPRPSDLQETATAQGLSSTPAATRAGDAPSISTTVINPQHAEEMEYTMDEVLEAAEKEGKGSEAEHDAGDGVMAEENASDDEKTAEEDDDTAGKDLDVDMTIDGGAVSKPDVTNAEWETLVFYSEGATPGSVVSGRETLANIEEGDPVKDVSGGETPEKVVEGETPNVAEESTGGGLQYIVDLVDEPEDEEASVDERLVRRRTRMSILDEVDEPTGASELSLGGNIPRAGGSVPEESGAEDRRLAIERKRKGKHEAQDFPRKTKKNPTAEHIKKLMADAIKVPFTKA